MKTLTSHIFTLILGIILGGWVMYSLPWMQKQCPVCPELVSSDTVFVEVRDSFQVPIKQKQIFPGPTKVEVASIPETVDTAATINQHFATAYYRTVYEDSNYYLAIEDSVRENRIVWQKPTLAIEYTRQMNWHINNTYKVDAKRTFGVGLALVATPGVQFSTGPSLFFSNKQYFYGGDIFLFPQKGIALRGGIKLWQK